MLHLHGLHDQQQLAGGDLLPGCDGDADDGAGHGGQQGTGDDLVGREVTVLVDTPGVGRTHREAPEIDGVVQVPADLATGTYATVVVTAALGPDLEEQLNRRGWTLGHFPDSFTHSTLGGWVATRSSGMQSDKYGDIAEITRGLAAGA